MSKEKKYSDIKEMSFEQAMTELEQIVKNMEQGRDELEIAIERYMRGIALKKHCEQKLAKAKMQVEEIIISDNQAVGIKEEEFSNN